MAQPSYNFAAGADNNANIADDDSSSIDYPTCAEHFDISSNYDDDVLTPLPSARAKTSDGVWTPVVPRLALNRKVEQDVFRISSVSQSSRTHHETSKCKQSMQDNWRIRETEKVVGEVVMFDGVGHAVSEDSQPNVSVERRNPCGQIFEELMTLRSKYAELSRQNAVLARDLDKSAAESERLKVSLKKRSVESEDLSRRLRVAMDSQTVRVQELLDTRLVQHAVQENCETQAFANGRQSTTRKNDELKAELPEKRYARTEHTGSIEDELLAAQRINFEIDGVRDTSRKVEMKDADENCDFSCRNKPVLLGRTGIVWQREACSNAAMDIMDGKQETLCETKAVVLAKAAVLTGLVLWNVAGFSKRFH